ncbi:MAG: PD-(D/E)XK nuclease family protein [Proteobacteria bacterium]|nr:PD-(D/E)XK nuclease family protein [Pseudomonadota bacterium]
MTAHAHTTPLLVPYHHDPFTHLAHHILDHHAADLSRVVVLLPQLQSAARLRHCLLDVARQRGHAALLGPNISTLRHWIEHTTPVHRHTLARHAAELLLAEALAQHPGLLGGENPWRLVDSLLQLFDELTLHAVRLPDDLEHFTQQLLTSYGVTSKVSGSNFITGLGREANLVHTLWRAWHQQLQAEGAADANSAYVHKLAASLDKTTVDLHFYLADGLDLAPAELAWARRLAGQGRLTWLIHGVPAAPVQPTDYHPDAPLFALLEKLETTLESNCNNDNITNFINSVYAPLATPFRLRAQTFAQQQPASPVQECLRVFTAGAPEQEAQAIDLQIRRWLLAGKTSIGIITEDRRLARRVRALLERAEVAVQDDAGWALSTTSAVSVLERWLQTLEEDFACLPLLDVLKSPFVFADQERTGLLATVYRFEQDIILHENVMRGLARYRKHLAYRQARLPASFAASAQAVAQLLDKLEHAAAPLQLFMAGKRHRPEALLNALQESLHRLGVTEAWATDAAGQSVLRELQAMRHALTGRTLRMDWTDFRVWLARTLERANFFPAAIDASVHVLALRQTALVRFDAIVIAGADAAHWPGSADASPYFNSTVRRELGLPTPHDTLTRRYHDFRRLLQSAPQVLITVCREQQGQPVRASPWLEMLQSFHQLAYQHNLEDETLARLLQDTRTQVFRSDTTVVPQTMTYPRPSVAAALVPGTLSASAHQQMIDCPYQFFAARCLRLEPVEALRERLQKSDYGERVHRILSAFHRGQAGLPGPFTPVLMQENRADAEHCLRQISHAVFAQDLEDNFEHRGWLKRWLAVLPHYLDWQIERAQHWQVAGCEVEMQRAYPDIELKGRLDRIDHDAHGSAIIDYKTGAALPTQDDVEAGEAVQLPFYALLAQASAQPVTRVEYVAIKADKISAAACLEGEALSKLAHATEQRLIALIQELRSGAPMPAWGDEKTCAWCAMSGLCRKQMWVNEPS